MYNLDRTLFVNWAVERFQNEILHNCKEDICLGMEFIISDDDLLDMCKDRNMPIPGSCFTPPEKDPVNPFMVKKIVHNTYFMG